MCISVYWNVHNLLWRWNFRNKRKRYCNRFKYRQTNRVKICRVFDQNKPMQFFSKAVCACIEIRNGFFQMDRIECARCDLGRWCSNIFNLIAQMQCIEARKFWCIIIFNTICVQINGQDVRLRWWRWRQAIVIITMMLQIIIACELLRVRGGALRTRSSALISYCCYINIEACGEHRAHTKRTEHTVWSAFSHSLTHSIERRQY